MSATADRPTRGTQQHKNHAHDDQNDSECPEEGNPEKETQYEKNNSKENLPFLTPKPWPRHTFDGRESQPLLRLSATGRTQRAAGPDGFDVLEVGGELAA